MAEEHEDVLAQASKSERDRRRAESGQMHPLRYQFEGLYEGRPELSGTPTYQRDWLNAPIPDVPRFRGRDKPSKGPREGAARGSVPTFNINMFDMSQDRSDRSVTTNNYMGGRGFVDDDSEPDWGSRGGQFVDAESFEPMSHDLFNVRERGGGNWESAGDLSSGALGIGPGDSSGALGV